MTHFTPQIRAATVGLMLVGNWKASRVRLGAWLFVGAAAATGIAVLLVLAAPN
jgi:hypothetical protein